MITAAAAPAVLEAAPATASATPDPAASGVFDAILALQGFAGTTDTWDAANFEAGDTTDALAADDLDDEDSDEDIDPSLAFLADLIAAASAQSASNGASSSGGSPGGDGEVTHDDAAPRTAPLADAGFLLAAGTDTDGKADLLPGLTTAFPETLEKRPTTGDASQNLARAVELLSPSRGAAAVETARPAVLTHVRDPRWADDFGARVSLMVRAGESTASLAMTPLDLGPVEVKVTVKDSQASIQFAATQADTRALIEASLPKLRELLASQGFNLLDASVSSGFSRSQQPAFASTTRGGANGESETSTTEARVIRQLGLLDLYA